MTETIWPKKTLKYLFTLWTLTEVCWLSSRCHQWPDMWQEGVGCTTHSLHCLQCYLWLMKRCPKQPFPNSLFETPLKIKTRHPPVVFQPTLGMLSKKWKYCYPEYFSVISPVRVIITIWQTWVLVLISLSRETLLRDDAFWRTDQLLPLLPLSFLIFALPMPCLGRDWRSHGSSVTERSQE